jgi:hypothetical protein
MLLQKVNVDVDKNTNSKPAMFEYLKFNRAPKYDVLAKTKAYTESWSFDIYKSIFHPDYLLLGPVIGPINCTSLKEPQPPWGFA